MKILKETNKRILQAPELEIIIVIYKNLKKLIFTRFSTMKNHE